MVGSISRPRIERHLPIDHNGTYDVRCSQIIEQHRPTLLRRPDCYVEYSPRPQVGLHKGYVPNIGLHALLEHLYV